MSLYQKCVNFVKGHAVVLQNFSYLTILQFFVYLAPLITYPYLVKVLGMELYGLVLTAQVLVSYASIIIDFGSMRVCAKHVSINRDNPTILSEVVSSVLCVKFVLWLLCLGLYVCVVLIIPAYRQYFWLFLFTYGFTTNDLLFPQYFFQGIEKMKYSTIVNIVVKSVFIALVFIFVKKPEDFLRVPLLYTTGYFLGGLYAMYIVFGRMKIKFYIPKFKAAMFYVKDCGSMFATDLICTIKDKLNVLLLGRFSGMANVVVYDLGMKIYSIVTVPTGIVSTVMFPRSAKAKNIKTFNIILFGIVFFNIFMILVVNLCLPWIVQFFIHQEIDYLPLRLFTIAPLFASTGQYIISNMCIAYGYNKFALYSILFTTLGYILTLTIFYFTHFLSSIYAFVLLAVISYFVEFVYRVYAYKKVKSLESTNNISCNEED